MSMDEERLNLNFEENAAEEAAVETTQTTEAANQEQEAAPVEKAKKKRASKSEMEERRAKELQAIKDELRQEVYDEVRREIVQENNTQRKSYGEVMCELQAKLNLGKDSYNAERDFHYRSADELIRKIKEAVLPYGYYFRVLPTAQALGNTIMIKVRVALVDKIEGVEVAWACGLARDEDYDVNKNPMQTTGTAETYAIKRALQNLFLITDAADDPDSANSDRKPAEPAKPAAPAKPQTQAAAPQAPAEPAKDDKPSDAERPDDLEDGEEPTSDLSPQDDAARHEPKDESGDGNKASANSELAEFIKVFLNDGNKTNEDIYNLVKKTFPSVTTREFSDTLLAVKRQK